jgi:glycosyltransferase involved in cell wall biosynthesis
VVGASDHRVTVVHLITTLGQGGAERALSLVVPGPDGASEQGERHVVVSLAPGGMFVDLIRDRGIEVRDLGMRPGRDLLVGLLRFRRLIRELRPTHVIAWMYHAMFLADLASLLPLQRRSRPRHVWMIQGSLHTTEGLPWHTRAIIRVLARRSAAPDVIAINSDTGRDHHIAHGYAARRWAAVPSGCDTTVFRPDASDRRAVRKELDISEDAIVAIAVARDHPQKDHPTMIAAMERAHESVDRLELLLVGTRTERFARRRPDGLLTIHGLGERGDVTRLLRSADIVVSSSITEGMPNALLEAMASGLPAAVTDVGDCRAAVGEAGHVVAPRDPEALADAIVQLAELPPDARHALGARARSHIIAEFGVERAQSAYRALWGPEPARITG